MKNKQKKILFLSFIFDYDCTSQLPTKLRLFYLSNYMLCSHKVVKRDRLHLDTSKSFEPSWKITVTN